MAYVSLRKCALSHQRRKKNEWNPLCFDCRINNVAMLCTRPDIAYALGIASRFQTDLEVDHWKLIKNILKYLKKTKDIFLIYGRGSELKPEGYTDSSF